MKQSILLLLSFLLVAVLHQVTGLQQVAAAATCDATTVGQCLDNKVCIKTVEVNEMNVEVASYRLSGDCGGSAVFGRVSEPKGLAKFNWASETPDRIGIISFASLLLNLAAIIAGIWVMFNFIFAGWLYIISEGDAGTHAKVNEKITFSVIGILVIVAAYTIAGVLSLLFFGDALFILSPTLTTIQTVGTP
jgi:hypothetical protein